MRLFKILLGGLVLVFVCNISFAENLEDKIDAKTLDILEKWDKSILGGIKEKEIKFKLSVLDEQYDQAAELAGYSTTESYILAARYVYEAMGGQGNFTDFWIDFLTHRLAIDKDGKYKFSNDIDEHGVKPGHANTDFSQLRVRAYMQSYKKFLKEQIQLERDHSQQVINSYQAQINFLEKGE